MERVLKKSRQGEKIGEDYVKSPVVERHHGRSFSAA
jgi:hypothetical protein